MKKPKKVKPVEPEDGDLVVKTPPPVEVKPPKHRGWLR